MDTTLKSTPNQRRIIAAILVSRKMMSQKSDIVEGFTDGRTTSLRELTFTEAAELIDLLNKNPENKNPKSKLMSKLFAMCHEMGWITTDDSVNEKGKLIKKKNYQRVHDWVEKYGYLKKPLREYTYKELPKLVSIFEEKIYNVYIQNLSSKP